MLWSDKIECFASNSCTDDDLAVLVICNLDTQIILHRDLLSHFINYSILIFSNLFTMTAMIRSILKSCQMFSNGGPNTRV